MKTAKARYFNFRLALTLICLSVYSSCSTSNIQSNTRSVSCSESGQEIWIAHGQSNIQGEQSPSGDTAGSTLAESVALEYKSSGELVAYDETNGSGIGDWNVPGFPSFVLAESKKHSWYYAFAKNYHSYTNKQIIAVPIYRGATALTEEAALSSQPDKYWINNPSWPGLNAGYAKVNQARALLPNAKVYIFMYAGEYEAFALNSGNLSKDNFKTQLRSHILDLINQIGAQKVYASVIHDLAQNTAFKTGVDLVEQVQQELSEEMPEFTLVYSHSRTDLAPAQYHHDGDYIHLNAQGMDRLGEQSAIGIAQDMGCYP